MEKIEIYKWKEKYYLAFSENTSDIAVAQKLGLLIEDYRKNISEMYNKDFGKEIYFDTVEDCQIAIDWIESILVLNGLCK